MQFEKERERNRITIIILYAENLPQSSTPPAVLLAGGVICISDDCHTLSHRSGSRGVWRDKSAFDAVSCVAALDCISSMRGGKFLRTAKELCPHRGSKQKVILHKINFFICASLTNLVKQSFCLLTFLTTCNIIQTYLLDK